MINSVSEMSACVMYVLHEMFVIFDRFHYSATTETATHKNCCGC